MPPKIKPILKCMPWHVKQKIVEDADTRTKITLRQCTKELKTHVEKSIIVYDRLAFHSSLLRGENARIGWQFPGEPDCSEVRGRIEKVTERFFDALNSSSRVHLKDLSLCFQRVPMASNEFLKRRTEFLEEFQSFLSDLKEKLHVEKFHICSDRNTTELLQILQFLKPGTLKSIDFSHDPAYSSGHRMDMNAIAETDQWKQAESCEISVVSIQLPFQKWKHFNEISIRMAVPVKTVREMMRHFIASPSFKLCEIEDYRECYEIPYLQYFLRFNPSITHSRTERFRGVNLEFKTIKRISRDEKLEFVMKIRVSSDKLRIEKMKKSDYVEDTGEDIERLEAATLLDNADMYL